MNLKVRHLRNALHPTGLKVNHLLGFWDRAVRNPAELQEQLRIGSTPQRLDPRCRFM